MTLYVIILVLQNIMQIFGMVQYSKARPMKQYYIMHKDRFQKLDDLSIDAIGALIGKRNLKIFKQDNGGLDMCKAFEDEREEGRKEGIYATLFSLVKDGLLRLEDAAKRINVSEAEFTEMMSQM